MLYLFSLLPQNSVVFVNTINQQTKEKLGLSFLFRRIDIQTFKEYWKRILDLCIFS
jgi:hypothetical protein